jgi:hypothetical protein
MECLLKVKQIFIHVSDLPKKPVIRDKTKALGFQRVEPKSGQPKVTWL